MSEENHESRDEYEFEIEHTFGDIVSLDGYPNRVFRVMTYRTEIWHYPDGDFPELIYEVSDVVSGEYVEADADDITFLADAEHAKRFLKNYNMKNYPKPGAIDYRIVDSDSWGIPKEARSLIDKSKKPTPREESSIAAEERKRARKERYAQIDNMLEILKWNLDRYKATGDESFNDRAFAVKAELKKIVETD